MKLWLWIGLMAAALSGAASASNLCTSETAAQRVTDLIDGAFEVNQLPENAQVARLRDLLVASFDMDFMGQVVLGDNAKDVPQADIKRFNQLYPAYFSATYGDRIGRIVKDSFKIVETKERRIGEFTVRSQLERKEAGDVVEIVWRVRCDSAGIPLIIDFSPMGVSNILTTRSDFSSIIKERGFIGLLTAMEERGEL